MQIKNILAENRALGWCAAVTAPPRIAARIIEIRSAIIAKKPIPEPSSEYRSQAETFIKRLFPTRVNQRTEQPTTTHVDNLRRELTALSIF